MFTIPTPDKNILLCDLNLIFEGITQIINLFNDFILKLRNTDKYLSLVKQLF